MPTRTMLTVPQPCYENWVAMTPAAQGRHCAACNKVVVDFTQKTDAEILVLLRRPGSTCGRFRADQLSRPLLPPVPAPHWRTWLAAAATVLGLLPVAAERSYGQQPAVQHDFLTHDAQKMAALRQRVQPASDTTSRVLRGRVTDLRTGDGLPGATVRLKNSTTDISTNADGIFELPLPVYTAADQVVEFLFIGYATEEKSLTALTEKKFINMPLETQVLGEMVGYRAPLPWHPRSLWHWARYKFWH